MIGRRHFLAGVAGVGLASCSSQSEPETTQRPPSTEPPALAPTTEPPPELTPFVVESATSPFGIGVASGDPTDDGFVIWTRLVDGGAGNPVANGKASVKYAVSARPDMSEPILESTIETDESLGHAVHVTVASLTANTTWYYRFEFDGQRSPTGRAATLGPAERRRLVVASCQHYEDGYFGAWSHAAAEDADLIVHVGDAIYGRGGVGESVRSHGAGRPSSLEDFRRRYALYWADPDLQNAHGSMSWCAVWDDNEVRSNFVGTAESDDFAALSIAAYRAWWEHNPTRAPMPEPGVAFEIHRSVDLGEIAILWLLDGRQYRDEQVCEPMKGLPVTEQCNDVDDETRTMLGFDQENWLADGLAEHDGRWQLIAQQTVLGDFGVELAGRTGINNDQWDGYAAARRRLLGAVGDGSTVVLSGDIHASAASTLLLDGVVVSHEIVVPSITSRIDPLLALGLELTVGSKPDVHYFDADRHGYVMLDVAANEVTAMFRQVETSTPRPSLGTGPVVTIRRDRTLVVN